MDLETLALLSQIFCYLTLPAIIGWGVWKLTKEGEEKQSVRPEEKPLGSPDQNSPGWM